MGEPEQGQPGGGRPQGPGDGQPVAGAGAGTGDDPPGLADGGDRQRQHRPARGVPADQRDPVLVACLAHARVDPFEGGRGRGRRHRQGDHQPARLGAHGGDVGQVDGHRLPAPVFRGGQLGVEVPALDHDVGGDHEPPARCGHEHGGVVAQPDLDPRTRGRPRGQPGDQPELAERRQARLGRGGSGRRRGARLGRGGSGQRRGARLGRPWHAACGQVTAFTIASSSPGNPARNSARSPFRRSTCLRYSSTRRWRSYSRRGCRSSTSSMPGMSEATW